MPCAARDPPQSCLPPGPQRARASAEGEREALDGRALLRVAVEAGNDFDAAWQISGVDRHALNPFLDDGRAYEQARQRYIRESVELRSQVLYELIAFHAVGNDPDVAAAEAHAETARAHRGSRVGRSQDQDGRAGRAAGGAPACSRASPRPPLRWARLAGRTPFTDSARDVAGPPIPGRGQLAGRIDPVGPKNSRAAMRLSPPCRNLAWSDATSSTLRVPIEMKNST
jgi:hypothetical protein